MIATYTEKARRAIFLARDEVSQLGGPPIEPEHLLLGLLGEDEALMSRFFPRLSSLATVRRQVEERMDGREKIAATTEVPLSDASKVVLTYAAEEAERRWRQKISTGHLLLGLLMEGNSVAAQVLYENGLRQNNVRDGLWHGPEDG